MSTFVLYGNPGWGSAIVEAQLAHYGLPFRYEPSGDLFDSAEARQRRHHAASGRPDRPQRSGA